MRFHPNLRVNSELPSDSSRNAVSGWLYEQRVVQERLWGIIVRLRTSLPSCGWEDLFQEALVNFWATERECPGQTESWYLQNARFHLLNLLKSGRSLDSPKRERHRSTLPIQAEFDDDGVSSPDSAFLDPFIEICAHDFLDALNCRLAQREQAVLKLRLEGVGTCDIAVQLHLSARTVARICGKIAAIAKSL